LGLCVDLTLEPDFELATYSTKTGTVAKKAQQTAVADPTACAILLACNHCLDLLREFKFPNLLSGSHTDIDLEPGLGSQSLQ